MTKISRFSALTRDEAELLTSVLRCYNNSVALSKSFLATGVSPKDGVRTQWMKMMGSLFEADDAFSLDLGRRVEQLASEWSGMEE